jgi:acetylcholinesterase
MFNSPPPEESEDCLYLNVWAPSGTPPDKGWPVMMWFYGGGFQFGSGGLPGYDGTAFASNENIVLVTQNYRTNGMLEPYL